MAGTALARALSILGLLLAAPAAAAAPPGVSPACSGAEHRQFDFWIGDWDVQAKGELAGRNRIEAILGGCALLESWEGVSGGRGVSLNAYAAGDGRWHQTWVDAQGARLELAGGWDEASSTMTLGGHGARRGGCAGAPRNLLGAPCRRHRAPALARLARRGRDLERALRRALYAEGGAVTVAHLLASGATLLPLLAATLLGGPQDAAGRDREAILDHIRGIFQAYVDRDRETIRKTHSADWTGFQGPSTKIERGLDDYMANAERSLAAFRGTGYELLDAEVQLFGEVALVYYIARYDYLDTDGKPGSLGLRALDVYRRERGEWIQCGSHITPLPAGGAWGEGH
jgi:ketosteroid isomerase-like protein